MFAANVLKDILSRGIVLNEETVNRVLGESVLPNLIWKGGAKAASLRDLAMQNLFILLNSERLECVVEGGINATLISLMGNIDDDLVGTREYALKNVCHFLNNEKMLLNGMDVISFVYL